MVEISVLMPCHNEMHTIKKNIDETIRTLKSTYHDSFELIVIDDGSSDGTLGEIRDGAFGNGFVKCVQIHHNHGKGNALRKGFKKSKGKYVCFLDGDLDLHPRSIKVFVEIMERDDADVVIGSKRHPLSVVNYPMKRKILSVGYHLMIKRLFDLSITDSQVGLKLFKREVLEDIFHRVLVKKFAFDIELLVNIKRNNYKIVEAPIEMDFISAVGSKVDMKAVGRMFLDTCAIYYRTNILHYYDNGHREHEINNK